MNSTLLKKHIQVLDNQLAVLKQQPEGEPERLNAFNTLQATIDALQHEAQAEFAPSDQSRIQLQDSILQSVPITIYTLDLTTNQLTFINTSTFLDYTQEDLRLPGSILYAVHPDDLTAVQTHWAALSQNNIQEPLSITYRIRSKAGQWHWLHSLTQIITAKENGLPAQILVSLTDITNQKLAETALRESENRFRMLYERTPLAYQSLDSDGNILIVNNAWLKTMGYETHELDQVVGRWFGEFLPSEEIGQFEESFPQFKQIGEVHNKEFTMCRKDGSLILTSFEGQIGHDQAGNFQQTHCILNNITDQRRKEKKIHLQTKALAAAANAIVITNRQGVIEWCNPAFTALTGYTAEEYTGQTPSILNSGHHDEMFYKNLWKTILAGQTWQDCMINRRKDGTIYYEETTITPVRDEQGEISHFIAIKQDVSDKIKNEDNLRKWAQIFENADWGVVVSSTNTPSTIEMLNPAFAHMHGWEADELVGKPLSAVFAPESRADLPRHIQLTHDQGQHSYETWHIHKDGSIFPVFVNVTAVKDPQGHPLYRVANVQDITERVHAETEIRQQSAELALINKINHAANRGASLPEIIHLLRQEIKHILAAEDVSVYLLDPDRQYLFLQDISLAPTLIEKLEALIGQKIPKVKIRLEAGDYYHDILQKGKPFKTEDPALIKQMMAEHTENKLLKKLVPKIARLLRIQSVIHIPLMAENGPVGLLDISRKSPFEPGNLQQAAQIAEQLTAVIQRKQAEDAFTKISRRNRLILQAAAEGIYGLDINGNTIFLNTAAESILGWAENELIGKPHHDLIHHSHADSAPYAVTDCPIHQTIQKGTVYRSSSEHFWRKDGTSFPVEYATSPIYENGEIVGTVVTFIDISERLHQEEYLQAQQRLATVGQLAAGIAHDFNNIMAVISLYSDLAKKAPDTPLQTQEYLTTIHGQANRAANLIRQILDFSRQSVVERQAANLLPFLKEQIKLLERTIPENIHLKFSYSEKDYLANVDLSQLQQAIMNLAINARDAMPQGGQLQLKLSKLSLGPGTTPPLADMPPGDWHQLDIIDSGTGIASENLSHIFEPFFTTKEIGQGTGLGLAQVHGIVKQHEGYIHVNSQIGIGSTFTIYLPALKVIKEKPVTSNQVEINLGNNEMILIVEDESAMRAALCDILESFNYHPLCAANGEEALQLYDKFANEIKLVLSDVTMPGISGITLHEKLTAQNPEVKVILMSGYPMHETGLQTLGSGIVDWLKKPINMPQLAKAIAQALKTADQGKA